MKIAVTSQNFRTITSHAGKARRFLMFEADPASGEVQELDRLDLPKEMAFHSFTGNQHPVDQVDVIVTGGCGAGFFRKMGMRGIQAIATSETDPAKAVQALIKGEALPEAEPHSH